MCEHTVKADDQPEARPSRRELLSAAAAAACAAVMPRICLAQHETPSTKPAPETADLPHWLRDHPVRSTVVDVRSSSVIGGNVVDPSMLSDMLSRGVRDLTGAQTRTDAWRTILGKARRIVLKFNSVGARLINTTDAVARELFAQIVAAGYEPSDIVLVEAPEFLIKELGTRPVPQGWDGGIDVGDGREPLARYLLEADAIVNVPFLKTHQIAGMSCCLKNISHAVIRHPARYHANGCSPYVAQIVAAKDIRSRIRLNVVDALRLVARHGPDAREEDIVAYGGLLLGFDPLAVDQVAYSALSVERRGLGMTGELLVPYLDAAARIGLGRAHPADIKRVVVDMRG